MAISSDNLKDGEFIRIIKDAVDGAIERAVDAEIENVKKRIEGRREEIIAGVILQVNRNIMIDTFEDRLTIQINNSKDV